MKILVVGLGVIGTTYGYVLKNAGHTVEHYVRPDSPDRGTSRLSVSVLDGRNNNHGSMVQDTYNVNLAKGPGAYDMIIMSLSSLRLEDAVKTLNDNQFTGPIILLCGVWEERRFVEQAIGKREYVLGYPVAGGHIDREKKRLECVIFDHLVLETKQKARVESYDRIIETLASANLKVETPYDMLEWIWIHMGLNAAVISTAASVTDATVPAKAAEELMDSTTALHKTILTIRECLRIIESRGVDLRRYRQEILPYTLPAWLSAVMMKRMFAKNQLTRRIMLLHANIPDLVYVCRNVYDQGKTANVNAPLFYNNYKYLSKFEEKDVVPTIT